MNLSIPHKALSLAGGEEAEPVTPEVNDPVSFTVEGVVTGKSGDNCEVEVQSVNGERISPGKESETEEKSEDEDLEAMAMQADEEEGY